MRIAINGFGRIGRTLLRILLQQKAYQKGIDIGAINIGPARREHVAYVFQYDTLMGTYPEPCFLENDYLVIGNKKIILYAEAEASLLSWHTQNIDWVVECSGRYTNRDRAQEHIHAGAQSVLISAPANGADITIIPGVNMNSYIPDTHHIISLGSCTTNAIVPLIKIMDDAFGVVNGVMTTVHAYTSSQKLLDGDASDLRRARAATLNIIPTSTGSSRVIDEVLPSMVGRISCIALRVPVAKVSLVQFSWVSKKPLFCEDIKVACEQASSQSMKNIVAICNAPLVSSDFSGNPHSVSVDALLTKTSGSLGTVFGWYDNEYGYSARLYDFLMHCEQKRVCE